MKRWMLVEAARVVLIGLVGAVLLLVAGPGGLLIGGVTVVLVTVDDFLLELRRALRATEGKAGEDR